MSSEAKSVLIILMGSIGDVARGLPLVNAIKDHHPDWQVTWLVEPKSLALLEMQSELDRILVFKRGGGIKSVWRICKELRGIHFDIVLDLQRHFKSGFFSLISGAKERVGFTPKESKEFNWFFNNRYISAATSTSVSKLERYKMFLEELGIAQDAYKVGQIDIANLLEHFPNERINRDSKFIVCVLNSSWRSKDWVMEGYIKTMQPLLQQGINLVLVGDSSGIKIAEGLERAFGVGNSASNHSGAIINLVNRTTLKGLLALLKFSSVAFGPDSGPSHMAALVGTPYVSLFGPTDPGLTAPLGSEHLVVKAQLGCMPCYRRECPGLDRLCMRLIPINTVIKNISQNI